MVSTNLATQILLCNCYNHVDVQGLGTRVGEVELTNDIHMRRNIVDMIQLKISVKNVIAVT